MLEVYHFADPMHANCLTTEQHLTNILSHVPNARLRFVPTVDPTIIEELSAQIDQFDWQATKDNLAALSFRICLDFKAAQLEGNKKARNFLIGLQEALHDGLDYSEELVFATAEKFGLNTTDFAHHRQVSEAGDAVLADQRLATTVLPNDGSAIAIEDGVALTTHFVKDFTPAGLAAAFKQHAPQLTI